MGEIIEEVRIFLTEWALAIAALLGLIIAWRNTKETIFGVYKNLNLYSRIHRLEIKIKELVNCEEP